MQAKQKDETEALRAAISHAGRTGKTAPPAKKQKNAQRDAVLAGRRVLDLSVARALVPPGAYIYETTDGRRVRVFYGKRRRSTSSMISIGKPRAILNCLRWSWTHRQLDPGSEPCTIDFDKIKLQ